MKLSLILFTTIAFLASCESKTEKSPPESITEESKKEVLLIGTFHYHNPGADIAKTKSFDVLDEESQNQLELIAEKIREFNPDKIFVEWPFDEQKQLDSLYNLYQEDMYFDNDSLTEFYRKNEIFQLAFRAALKNKLKSVDAIDYHETQFPFDSLLTVIAVSNQKDIQTEIENGIRQFTKEFDDRIEKGASLLDLTYYLNSGDMRQKSNKFHTEIPLLAGAKDNFIGPFLSSEWHRRNLYMWSLAQKSMEKDDHKMVLLLGASHVAMIKDYIDRSEAWKAVELQEIME
ncbi:MAG: DUF5694 domain-containing protein [Chitinophagaceae bacterium]